MFQLRESLVIFLKKTWLQLKKLSEETFKKFGLAQIFNNKYYTYFTYKQNLHYIKKIICVGLSFNRKKLEMAYEICTLANDKFIRPNPSVINTRSKKKIKNLFWSIVSTCINKLLLVYHIYLIFHHLSYSFLSTSQ